MKFNIKELVVINKNSNIFVKGLNPEVISKG